MVKQLNLIKQSASQLRKGFVITRKNEALMKQCFEDCYSRNLVSNETIEKVRNTDYVNKTLQ